MLWVETVGSQGKEGRKRRTEGIRGNRHSIARGGTSGHQVAVSRLEDASFDLTSVVRVLFAFNDGEIIVGKETTAEAFCADR